MGPPKMVSGTHTIPISLGIRTWECYGNEVGPPRPIGSGVLCPFAFLGSPNEIYYEYSQPLRICVFIYLFLGRHHFFFEFLVETETA